jgi:hypothetical protein
MATAIAETTDGSNEETVTGPHPEYDKDGQYTGYDYLRCEVCKREMLVSIKRKVGFFEHAPDCPTA